MLLSILIANFHITTSLSTYQSQQIWLRLCIYGCLRSMLQNSFRKFCYCKPMHPQNPRNSRFGYFFIQQGFYLSFLTGEFRNLRFAAFETTEYDTTGRINYAGAIPLSRRCAIWTRSLACSSESGVTFNPSS
jgi:hypothetical protein